jgi:hypothetical protein
MNKGYLAHVTKMSSVMHFFNKTLSIFPVNLPPGFTFCPMNASTIGCPKRLFGINFQTD